jgi:hypothetical protein
VDDFERDQLVILGGATGDEEQRGISAINDLGVCNELASQQDVKSTKRSPLYSRKLHIRVRLARTSWETSLTILALSLGDNVVNHLARRCTRVSSAASTRERERETHHLALSREQNQIAVNIA